VTALLFEATVALEAVRGELPPAELAEKHDVHSTQIALWKADLVKGAQAVFDGRRADKPDIDVKRLNAKIGELAVANDFLESALFKAGKLSARK
jgi:transposase